jgi:hypothetical protein
MKVAINRGQEEMNGAIGSNRFDLEAINKWVENILSCADQQTD